MATVETPPDLDPGDERRDPADASAWHSLVEGRMSRRTLLKGAAAGAVAAAVPLQLRTETATATGRPHGRRRAFFSPIAPTAADALVLPRGFRADVLAAYGSPIGKGLTAGFNHDWIGYYPIDLLERGTDPFAPDRGFSPKRASSREGLLVINHEYVNPLFVGGYSGSGPKSPEQLAAEQAEQGISVLRVRRDRRGRWSVVEDDDAYARRIDATSALTLDGPAAAIDGGPAAVGTFANCSGGMTPWGTALSCEENFAEYTAASPAGSGWPAEPYGRRHYGWVVEVDPFDRSSTPRKHTAMGLFRHENVAIRVGRDGTVVAYMGDDKADSCVYKFVADTKLSRSREANMSILSSGKLYVANFGKGAWVLLDYDSSDALKAAVKADGTPQFASQTDVLADARGAALVAGGTPVDRPEDIEVNPVDHSVFVALTNNTGHGNFHGQIVRLAEADDDPAATAFEWSIFAVGGPQSGFSSPDNLIFDAAGDLWMVTDISSSSIGTGIYAFQGNNALFYLPTSGPDAGTAYQFASGPVQCEMTGPQWTPDGSTLFLSVQHPGEGSPSADAPTSRWPNGGADIPRPASVAITGPWEARRGRR
ncbi:MAG: PhoX family phosphatase [Thermoleophilia bacterium]